MIYDKKEKMRNKREFIRDRISMFFGSLANLYSSSSNPPTADEIYNKAIELAEKSWELGTIMDEFPELDEKLMEKTMEEVKEREIGVYYCSELYDYFTNKIPPEKFLEPKIPNLEELKMMAWGTIIHKGIQSLFNYEEKRVEITLKSGIRLVGKIDLILPNEEIVELKTKEFPEIYEELPLSYLYQITAYMKALNKEKMRVYFVGWHLCRKRFDIEFNLKIWEDIEKRLYDYHKKVVTHYVSKKI